MAADEEQAVPMTHGRRRARAGVSLSSSMLTKEVQDRIVARISSGVWLITEAVMAEGFSRSAHYEWLRKGAAGMEPYAAYLAAVERAKAEMKSKLMQRAEEITKCGDPKAELAAITWILKCVDRKHFGDKVEVSAGASTPAREAYEELTDDQLEDAARKALGAGVDD